MGLRNRPLNDTQFRALLAWLDPDPNQAGAVYAKVHRRLCTYFEGWRDAARHAEELADAALDRAVVKLAQEPGIAARDATAYIRTIAGYILKEFRSRPQAVALTVDPPDLRAELEHEGSEDSRCLNLCLGGLSSEDYELIMEYYAHEKSADATRYRQEVLPLKLGKSYGALRVQVLRIRRALSECIAQCLNRGRGAGNATD